MRGAKTSPVPLRRVRACHEGALRWALETLVVNHLSMTRIAHALGVAWNTDNDAVLAEGQRLLIDQPGRLDHVTVVGVDEHVWRHTHKGDTCVTVVIDLTPVRDGTSPSRPVAIVEGRSKQAFTTWLADQPQAWRDGVKIVAMDGFTGFTTATAEELPDATTVIDPFHVVRLAGDALDACRRRVQIMLHGTRGRKHHLLYQNRRILHTGADLLTDTQQHRLDELFSDDRHVEVEATWDVYQTMITVYRAGSRAEGTKIMTRLIASIGHAVPSSLVEVARLGRTLTTRRDDILAFFDRPSTSNGPTEAINERLEHLRGTALGFPNLTNDTTRSLLDTGGFKPTFHRQNGRAADMSGGGVRMGRRG